MSPPRVESRVRVGVRIRPLTSTEISQGGENSLKVTSPSIQIGQRKFTYDTVFDSNVGQQDLYDNVSAPLLKSFSEGYNATIMAYGQTGSGKTFTMGSEAHIQPETSSHMGLIPRFITEFFQQIKQKKESSDKALGGSPTLLDYSVSASFLEVYGEDVFDLLDADRKSLPLREDSAGGVVIAGLTRRPVSNPTEILQVLHEGTMNRTTAATLMNLTSSRSHAVFTIHLTQVIRSETGDVDMTSNSKFTFVDLAGSERMKKTGAQGERAREGIKINEGLLALGNVINALADEERIAKEKKIHVPYRQSKLTRLLQDALGGNSQTLFLACVSPSNTNASETLSTLHYANRARNIRNAPTKNIDATAVELQRLHSLAHVLQCELIKSRFTADKAGTYSIGHFDDKLMERSDVGEYMKLIHETASQMTGAKESLPVILLPPALPSRTINLASKSKEISQSTHFLDSTPNKTITGKFDDSFLVDVNPDEDMAILDHLLELQQHDHDYDKERKRDDEQLRKMNGELEKEEAMLLKIKESLKVYHSLKTKYEELMAEVQQLEIEKAGLADQLEKSKLDPTMGSSAAIKKQLEKVELSLVRARQETRSHRQKYKIADEQAKKSQILERKITELKQAKRALIKKQKEDLARYKETTESKTKELLVLKRKDRAAGKKMSKLENEIQHHKMALDKRQNYCTKLSEKLKQTESHLLRLLTLRQRDLAKRTKNVRGLRNAGMAQESNAWKQDNTRQNENYMLSSDERNATRLVFDKMVWDKVNQAYLQNLYEERIVVYSNTMRKVMAEAKRLKEARIQAKEKKSTAGIESIHELEDSLSELELKLELLGAELKDIRARMPEETKTSVDNAERAVSKILGSMSRNVMRTMLEETMSKLVEAETQRKSLSESISRKDAALLSFESEVEGLTNKLSSLSKDLVERQKLSDSTEDPVELIRSLKAKTFELQERLDVAEREKHDVTSKVQSLKNAVDLSQREHAKTQEMLTFMEVSLTQQGGSLESTDVLEELQKVWEVLGVDLPFRAKEREAIHSSLTDTCSRKLNEALMLKASSENEIENLTNQLDCMHKALGDITQMSNQRTLPTTLLARLKKLQEEHSKLSIPYKYACARRETILNDAIYLSEELGLSSSSLPKHLKTLLEQDENTSEQHSDGSINSMTTSNTQVSMDQQSKDSFQILPAHSLESKFLTDCERENKTLRVKKSEMLIQNREMLEKISEIIGELHMSTDELLIKIELYFKATQRKAQYALDKKAAGRILHDAKTLSTNGESKVSDTLQIGMIHEALGEIAAQRQNLSSVLQSIIERAQKTLLHIVGEEVDASKAYANFHVALFQLPSLSQERSLACISEMEALVVGVEAMTQSETEALTVVWEALKVSSESRSNFWAQVGNPKSKNGIWENEFDDSLSPGCEEWIATATKRGKEIYKELNWKLSKLEEIHMEVEQLRSKQDTKSQILSLDSEIRILNSKLLEFEALKCGKGRLLSKKGNGSALLKEERFRKQMQAKFVSQLNQLADLLQSWEKQEGKSFNSSDLSDDVRMLLKEPHKMEDWVEKRTRHMHLRTVKANEATRKRAHQETGSDQSNLRKPKRTMRGQKESKRSDQHSTKENEASSSKLSTIVPSDVKKRNRADSNRSHEASPVDKRSRRKIRRPDATTPLRPFGRILAELGSPLPKSKGKR